MSQGYLVKVLSFAIFRRLSFLDAEFIQCFSPAIMIHEQ